MARQYSSELTERPSVAVQLVIDLELAHFDEMNRRLLQHALAGFLAIPPDAVKIVSVKEGSVNVILEIPAGSAKKLLEAYGGGDSELAKFLAPFPLLDLRRHQPPPRRRTPSQKHVDRRITSRVMTLPNILTVIRMALIPVFVGALYYQRFGWALAVFVVAGVTDGLDGLFARRFNQYSQLGQILDPIADKLLLVTSFITLSMPSIMAPEALVQPHPRHLPVPFWVTAAVISRDVFIIVGAATINVVTGFRGFKPSWLGKANTTVQIISVVLVLVAASVPPLRGYLPTVYTTVFAFAVISGFHYVFWTSKLLNEDRQQRDSAG